MSDDNKQAEGGTYFGQAQADAELQARGRFAQRERPQINGTAPTVATPGPLPIWATGPQPGPEPPLGYEIDAVEQMLTTEHR